MMKLGQKKNDGSDKLIEIWDPADGTPPIPDWLVPLYELRIKRITDPTDYHQAETALIARDRDAVDALLDKWP